MRSAVYVGPVDAPACATCGADAPPVRGQARLYCSARCKRRAESVRHRRTRAEASARWRARNPGRGTGHRPGYHREYYAKNRGRLRAYWRAWDARRRAS